MTWHTQYLSDAGRCVARTIDELPYHAVLLAMPDDQAGLRRRRASHLAAALVAERGRPLGIDTLPYHLVLDVSDLCNLRCPLCVQSTDPEGRGRSLMTLDTARHALDPLRDALVRVELFSWGEPLLNGKFVDITKVAQAASVFSRTSTHFSIAKGLDVEAILDSGLGWIVLSIDGATQDVYQRYRVGGHLDLVLENARKLIAAKRRRDSPFPIVEWQFLALQHNVEEIEACAALATDMGFDVFRYGGARGRMADRIRVPTAENFEASREHLVAGSHPLSEYDEAGEKLHQRETEGCRWLWGKVAVHADGGVSPCWTSWEGEADFGSLRKETIEALWRGNVFAMARSAATGSKDVSGQAKMCERCATFRAFVNAPERLETWPSLAELAQAADRLRRSGLEISDQAVDVVWDCRDGDEPDRRAMT